MSDKDALVGELHDLAGGWGLPAAVQYAADALPGSITGDVAYHFSVTLGLLVGDLAEVIETSEAAIGPPVTVEDGQTRRAKTVAPSPAAAAGVASAWVGALVRPFVHPWMVADPRSLRHAVDRLDHLTPRLAAAFARAQVSGAAAERTVRAVRVGQTGLAALLAALETDGTHLRRLTRERPFAVRRMRAHTDRLGDADAACRRSLVAATRSLPSVAALLTGTAWDGPSTAPVRSAVAHLAPAELAARIARDPALLAALTEPGDTTTPDWLVAAASGDETGEASHEASLVRVDRVRRACAEQDAETLRRAALLHPRAIGGLDGVPVDVRIRANRLVMRADLRRMRDADVALENEVAEQKRRDRGSVWGLARGAVLDAWLENEQVTAIATIRHERPLARRADLRAVITVTQQLLHDRVDHGRGVWGHRQVLAHHVDGRIVELTGVLDDRTEQVAVYVGGTGTTVRQYGWPTGIVRALHRADPTGGTAVVTWMGAEFPSAIGTQSPFGRFARAAAAPLRDLVEALDVPGGTPITVVGHSYGGVVVGAAEALGLRADRVVHAGVPGLGPGVRSVAAYPDRDGLGRPRQVVRYCLTAPGDLIRWWRRGDALLSSLAVPGVAPAHTAVGWIGERLLGADPTTAPGIVDLDTGIWEVDKDDRRAGEILFGPRGHADCVEPGTTSFRRIVEIVQGRDPRAVAPPVGIVPFRFRPGRRRRVPPFGLGRNAPAGKTW